VFFLAALTLGAATVPLAKGRLGAFGELELRWGPLLLLAVAAQGVILFLIPNHPAAFHEPLHVASYALIGMFVARNIRVHGMWSIALGGLCNAVVIVVNGGVMPVSRSALKVAGLYPLPARWLNARPLNDAALSFLGDIFPIPPLQTVVSVGDILVAFGAVVLIHGVSGSHFFPLVTQSLRKGARVVALAVQRTEPK
jgi:hypothetical protein